MTAFILRCPRVLLAIAVATLLVPAALTAQNGPRVSGGFPEADPAGDFHFSAQAAGGFADDKQPPFDPLPGTSHAPEQAGSRRITPRSGAIERPEQKKRKTAPGGSSTVYTTLGALALVIILILGFARLWKKHSPAGGTTIPSEALTLLGRKQLDPRNAVIFARIGSRILILGASTEGLRTLCEVTDPVEVDFLAGMCRHSAGDNNLAQTFVALFHRNVADDDLASDADRSIPLPRQDSTQNAATDGDEESSAALDPAILRLHRHAEPDESLETSPYTERA